MESSSTTLYLHPPTPTTPPEGASDAQWPPPPPLKNWRPNASTFATSQFGNRVALNICSGSLDADLYNTLKAVEMEMKNVPKWKALIYKHHGPPRITAKKQQQVLERVRSP
ncbi:hypothetical protein QJS10_CPA09g00838 [Acorus calamus]|uniref:Uncharacterized protein n=1 Tax=Acorus calamus TaxID=4465 RepID=A0AAV9E4R4_ACOCL|nr:hypothetical protein QJS10_CPA09g00838 [Acorus calamus]